MVSSVTLTLFVVLVLGRLVTGAWAWRLGWEWRLGDDDLVMVVLIPLLLLPCLVGIRLVSVCLTIDEMRCRVLLNSAMLL